MDSPVSGLGVVLAGITIVTDAADALEVPAELVAVTLNV